MNTIKNNRFLYFSALVAPYMLLLVVLFFRFKGLLIGDKILYYGDIETFYMPAKIFIARSITAGKIPLWSQNLFNGYPFFADPQNGTYYFLNIMLDYLIPNILIINYLFVISLFLTSVFSYLFSRTIGLGKIPSIVAALLFSYSYMILNFSYSFIAAYWFIPAIFLFFEKYIRNNRDSKYILISGLLFGFQILAGSPQIAFITMVGLIIYVFFRLFMFSGEKVGGLFNASLYFIKYIVLTAFVGLLISMIQILPTFVESLKSNVASVSRNFVLQSSLEPLRLFKNFMGIRNDFFFGILTPIFLVLIIFSLRFKNTYKNIFSALLLFILVTILIAFGRYFPLYEYFLIHLPFFDKFPLPQRFAILCVFGISMLAGISLNIVLNTIKSRSFLFSGILGIIVLSIVILNLFAISSQFDTMTKYKDIHKSFYFNNLLSAKLRNSDGRIYPVTGIYPFRMHLSASLPPYVLNNSLAAQTPLYYKNLDSITGTKVFVLKDYKRIVDTARSEGLNSKLYDLLNLRYIITGKPMPKNIKNVISIRRYDMKIEQRSFYLYLYRLKKSFNRSFLVKRIVFLKKNSDIFKRINSQSFNPKNTAYVLDNHPTVQYNECNGEVLIKKWDNNTIDMKTTANNNCFLFISNTFFDGWKAYINRKQQRVYKTDYNFQGVFVKKGSDKVTLIFDPLYFYIAELISLICLGEVLLLLIYLHIKKSYSKLK